MASRPSNVCKTSNWLPGVGRATVPHELRISIGGYYTVLSLTLELPAQSVYNTCCQIMLCFLSCLPKSSSSIRRRQYTKPIHIFKTVSVSIGEEEEEITWSVTIEKGLISIIFTNRNIRTKTVGDNALIYPNNQPLSSSSEPHGSSSALPYHFPLHSHPQLVLDNHSFLPKSSFISRFWALHERLHAHLQHHPYFAFTIVNSAQDDADRLPGVATGHDIRLSSSEVTYRVAVQTRLVQVHHWSIFQCYLHASSHSVPAARHTGFLVVSDEMIDIESSQPTPAARHEYVTKSIEKQWLDIPEGRKQTATALFPEDIVVSTRENVKFRCPRIFAEDYAT